MALTPISGEIISQALNDNFSYLNERKNDLAINVKDYGAKGDGVTDDTDAFVNAIAALKANGGGILYVPKGTYIIKQKLLIDFNNFTLQGQGQDDTVLQFNFTPAATDSIEVSASVLFTKFRDFKVYNGHGHGFLFNDAAQYIECRNIRSSFNDSDGFRIGRVIMSVFENCLSDHNDGVGFYGLGYKTSCTFVCCYANENVGNGFDFEDGAYCTFISCGSDFNSYGYRFRGGMNFTLNACGSENNDVAGFYLNGITNSTFSEIFSYQNNHDNATATFIRMDNGTKDIIFNNPREYGAFAVGVLKNLNLDSSVTNIIINNPTFPDGFTGIRNNLTINGNSYFKLPSLAAAPTGVYAGTLAHSDGTGGGFDAVNGEGLYRYNGTSWVYIG